MLGAFSEHDFKTPYSKSKKWFKAGLDLKKLTIDSLETACGSYTAAECLTNSVEIIYKSYIRTVVEDKVHKKSRDLRKELEIMFDRFVCKGSVMAYRCLPVQSEQKVIEEPDPLKKKGTIRKRVVVIKTTRPRIPKGPMTPQEETVVSNLNTALSRIEAIAPDWDWKTHRTPVKWEEGIAQGVERITTLTSGLSKVMLRRRADVRNAILALRRQNEIPMPQVERGITKNGITPDEWNQAIPVVLNENDVNYAREFLTGISFIMNRRIEYPQLID
uniref:Uncharacterized protein n=1 Tax=Lygus hesperus TaxID=30085 RepID=A0A146L968_LYGHE